MTLIQIAPHRRSREPGVTLFVRDRVWMTCSCGAVLVRVVTFG